jgi:hypothetical protein
MENKEKYFSDLENNYFDSHLRFVLNTKETVYFRITPQIIDELCGFKFKSQSKKERTKKLEKRKDKILNGPELCKYRLIKDTNYFSGENLRFVVFNPDLADYYADFIFNDKNGSIIALRTKLPFTPTTHDNQMIYKDTKLVLSDIFNVTNLDELLCGKTVAYPLEYIAFKYHKKYCNYDKEKLHEMVKAYGATFDVSKAERIDNFKKGKVKALQ